MNKKKKYTLYKFTQFCKEQLGITDKFNLKLSENRDGFKTYAYYNPNTKTIGVYIKNRAIADVMRSIAHELVHHKQYQNGEIKNGDKVQDVGGKIEDDANAIAGQLIKKFGYDNANLNVWNTEELI
jgi:Zn-dependent peptidase ImmA (M78 family)